MNYDYEEEEYNEVYKSVLQEVCENTSEIVSDDNFVTIDLKTDIIKELFQQVLLKQCEGMRDSIQANAIESIKQQLIDEKFDEVLKKALYASIKEKTDAIMTDFMDKKLTIANGYCNTKTISCKELIEERIEKFVEGSWKNGFTDEVNKIVDTNTRYDIDKFKKGLSEQVAYKIKDMFNQTTKDVLTDQLFNILSQNETYQQLVGNITKLIETKQL